jgi:glycosyltransferase involved in cell wall biosynthesis
VRIAYAIDNMQAGGTELNAVRVAERLDRRRFDLRVICMNPDGPLARRYEKAGIPVVPFRARSLTGPSALGWGIRLARLCRQLRINIFHAHDIYSDVFAAPWARLAGARVITSRRWWEGLPGPMWRTATRISHRAAHIVLANSPAIGMLLEREGVHPSRIAIVPNFVDAAAFEPIDATIKDQLHRELRLAAGPIVGIVANLLPIKDHASLLRAAATLKGQWPRLRVVLVGDGPCRADLEQLATTLDLGEHVVFAGRRPHLPNLQRLFDVSVLCSTSEGLPNVVLEAMAAGRPVVATNVGAVADAVVNGETGILVPPRNPPALAAGLSELLANGPRARRLGEAGAARARTHYSAEVALTSLERLYAGLSMSDHPVAFTDRPPIADRVGEDTTGPAAHRAS